LTGICLLSSGLDSVAALAIAAGKMDIDRALTFDYGQRSASRELAFSEKICDHYGIAHGVIQLDWLAEITNTSLVNREAGLPQPSEDELFSSAAIESAKAVWVPNRNGVMLNVAAAFAESLGSDCIITGFNGEEAVTFPDKSSEFVDVANTFFSYSTLQKVRVYAPLIGMDKEAIVLSALQNNAPLKWSWSCYETGPLPCGVCESCRRRALAFEKAGVEDPLFSEADSL
jgi:7-cyano-7-deazaguanine synthase